MGNSQDQLKITIGGLDAAGKTTILYQLKLGQSVSSVPTTGFNVQSVIIDKKKLAIWDLGGGWKIKQLHYHYLPGISGFAYVVDMGDSQRFDRSLEELSNLYLKYIDLQIPILILANKCDMLTLSFDILKKGIKEKTQGRNVYFAPCIAVTGAGIYDGFRWLVKQMNSKKYIQP